MKRPLLLLIIPACLSACTRTQAPALACGDVDRAKLDFIDKCKGIAFTNSTLSGRPGGGETACRCIAKAFRVEERADKNCQIPNADVVDITRTSSVKVECGTP